MNTIQPILEDELGTLRFRENEIVSALLEFSQEKGMDMNKLSCMDFSREDWVQFAQLIGYSVGGWEELSYVSNEDRRAVERIIEKGESEEQAKINSLSEQLENLKEQLRKPISELYDIHPDDLK
jgi:hypothetical protein